MAWSEEDQKTVRGTVFPTSKIIGLYAAGLTVRDIQAHLLDLYGLKVSPDLISRVTDAVLDEVREWSRTLDRMYPIVIFDALRVKIRDADSRMVKNKAVYVALGVTRDGLREVLGLRISESGRDHKTVRGDCFARPRLQLPALGDERAEEPRRAGHPDRGRRQVEGLFRGHGPDLLGWTAPKSASMCQNEVVTHLKRRRPSVEHGYPHRNGHVKARLPVA